MEGKGSATKDIDNQSSGSRKTTPGRVPQEQQVLMIKCPRCDSQNTKFCYYNNYSLTQPRHFCKTCRRYWTNGGALRNVPIGGGCRKNKKMKSANSMFSLDSKDPTADNFVSTGLKFFQGFTPTTDHFQLGGLNFHSKLLNNQFPPLIGDISIASTSSSCFNLEPSALASTSTTTSLMGFNYPFSSSKPAGELGVHQSSSSNLASSIESLSSLNQDLHWKLQQQRMATMLYAGGDMTQTQTQKESSFLGNQIEKPQPILFQNLEASKGEGKLADHSRKDEGNSSANVNLATEWYFDPAPTSSNRNEENVNAWDGIQAWSNLNQFSPFP